MINFFDFNANEDRPDEFKRHLPVNVTFDFGTLEPALGRAEKKYIKVTLGDALFNRLSQYYLVNHTDGPDDIINEAIEMIQGAEIRLAFYDSFEQLAVSMTDNGLQDMSGDNRAYRYQAEALKENLYRQGYEILNELMCYVEEHDEHLPEWQYSYFCANNNKSLVRNNAELFGHADMEADYRILARIRNTISYNENFALPSLIGKELAMAFVNREERTLPYLDIARQYIINKTMASEVRTLDAILSPFGFYSQSSTAESGAGGTKRNPSSMEKLNIIMDQYKVKAESMSSILVRSLLNDTETFPEIKEVYKDKEKGVFRLWDNDNMKSFKV